jgi:cyclopropane fatty-acyl-phospholipid synthase-like methyltransferase
MGYFDDEQNVEDYIKMAEGYDGRYLITQLRKYLPYDSTVLELGMGPGTDLMLLSEHYQVIGSDYSNAFLERFRMRQPQHPTAGLLQLDAITMQVDRRFDCIYSNKVLHMMTREQLAQSLQRQAAVLNDNGILLHSFWYGREEEEHFDIKFIYYTKKALKEAIGKEYQIVEMERYTEMDENDSLYVILRKRD